MTIDTDQGAQILQKLDTIASDVAELKVTSARTQEQLKALNERQLRTEERVKTQDNRLWGFVVGLVLALLGVLGKLAFFTPKI